MIVTAFLVLLVVAGLFLWLSRAHGIEGSTESKSPARRDSGTIHRDEYLNPEDEQRSLTLGANGLPNAELRRVNDHLVIVTRAGLVNPRSRSLHRVGLFVFKVRGMGYYEPASRTVDFRPGTSVGLVREPDNPHDPNAIGVLASNHGQLVGHVNRQTAARLTKLIDAGADVIAVSLIHGDSVPTVLAAERHVVEHLARNL